MAANWKILGLECSDGERCECCGTCCPKRRVVLTDGVQEVRYGTSCAAIKLLGDKKAGSVKVITRKATAADLARKWLAAGRLFACACMRQLWESLTEDTPCEECREIEARARGYDKVTVWVPLRGLHVRGCWALDHVRGVA